MIDYPMIGMKIRELRKEWHLVERFFLKLKNFRQVATRYDKLATSFLAFVYIATIFILLK